MVDEAHGAGVLGARGAGTAELLGVEDRVDLRMGTFSKSLASCGGFVAGPADVIEYLRISSRPFLFTASAVPASLGAALAALRVMRSPDGPAAAGERVLANARYFCATGSKTLGFAVVAPGAARRRRARTGRRPGRGRRAAARSSRRSSPCSSATTGRRRCCGAPSTTAGVFVNTALHPAVPPGGALLRTSVMATHDRAVLDRALAVFARVKSEFEAEHGPLPCAGADLRPVESRRSAFHQSIALVHFFTSPSGKKKGRF